jgi:SAM-dependent methyltransferase
LRVTGERVFTSEAGFNPTWQRHVAAYRLLAPQLPAGRVLDLGCGVGHSFAELAPRETVGVDVDAEALEGQQRETVVADMRELPFGDDSFASVVSVHSVEHVPDPERILGEVARVLEPGGTAAFVTPNRLTFAVPDEVIDPYHYREYSPDQLHELCSPFFAQVELLGLVGSERYLELVAGEKQQLHSLLRKDPLRLRRLLPRRVRQRLYDWRLGRARRDPAPGAGAIEASDFELRTSGLDDCLDVVAVCRDPAQRGAPAELGPKTTKVSPR